MDCRPEGRACSTRPVHAPMTSTRYDVLGLGNAIVDVIARTDDDFLLKQAMRKGSMSLIDEARAQAIYDAMGPAVEISGGSAANTIVGAASLGARAAFIGKVKQDQLGSVFAHDIRAAGVSFATRPAAAIAAAGFTYLEGYLWDPPHAKEAFLKAAKIAHAAERSVALSLSDVFCVERHRAEFLELIRTGMVDLVFANEHELRSLYETG